MDMESKEIQRLQAIGRTMGIPDMVGSIMERVEKSAEKRYKKGIFYGHSFVEPYPNTGRNSKCPCGSGIKYKKCCLNQNQNQNKKED